MLGGGCGCLVGVRVSRASVSLVGMSVSLVGGEGAWWG